MDEQLRIKKIITLLELLEHKTQITSQQLFDFLPTGYLYSGKNKDSSDSIVNLPKYNDYPLIEIGYLFTRADGYSTDEPRKDWWLTDKIFNPSDKTKLELTNNYLNFDLKANQVNFKTYTLLYNGKNWDIIYYSIQD